MYCKYCGKKQDSDAVFCFSCGAELSQQVAPTPRTGESDTSGVRKKKVPGVSLGPNSRDVNEYPDVDYEEAQRVWSAFSTRQRRMWNEAGRPNLLTFPGSGFEEWIIDNADDDFDFHSFVDDWEGRQREQPAVAPPQEQPLHASVGHNAAPGKVTAIVLASLGVLTFAVPLLCLPTSITAAVMATRGIRWERKNEFLSSTTLQIVRVAAIVAASTTTLLMVLAIPGAYDANFG